MSTKEIKIDKCPFCNKMPIFSKNRDNLFVIMCTNKICIIKPKGKNKDFFALLKSWNRYTKKDI